uniref:Ion_trans domain-containing protein n=1 Tax=Heterorhabditis bacteriophora TaxID=37862 RepID=A0A1I7XNT9_HETBA
MAEMKPFGQKLKYFFFNYWNTVTTAAVITYIIGFAMRTFGVIEHGRVVLACNSVLWTMKLLDYMSVHPRLGPYITMAGKMVVLNMSYIIVMLVVSLLAFGLARQSITYPNEDWHWLLVRNIFYKPYFMLYGEVYADEIDTCGDEAWDTHLENGVPITNSTSGATCVPGYWIPPILMTFFLLVANILLMSMLIAIFNHIFDQTDEVAQQIWLFQRYRQVLIFLESIKYSPYIMRHFRTDIILNRLNDLAVKEGNTRETISELDTRLLTIEKTQTEILDYLRSLMATQRVLTPTTDAPHPQQEIVAWIFIVFFCIRYLCISVISNFTIVFNSSSVRRQRHEEYTSITDSIAVYQEGKRLRGGQRSHSSDNPVTPFFSSTDSPLGSNGDQTDDEILNSVTLKRSTDRRMFDEEDAMRVREEEELADCELTDVLSDTEEQDNTLTRKERRSTDSSKEYLSFSIVNEEEGPRPSPRQMGSPKLTHSSNYIFVSLDNATIGVLPLENFFSSLFMVLHGINCVSFRTGLITAITWKWAFC